MKVSFRFDKEKGWVTDVPDRSKGYIKDSIVERPDLFSSNEHLALAMGSCTSSDVISIFKKMKAEYTSFRCEVDADRATEHPKTITKADIHYIIDGNVTKEQAYKAIGLSLTKYCSVSILARRGGTALTFSLTLNGERLSNHLAPEQAVQTS